MNENQHTVTQWQLETFGPTDILSAFERMQKEYWELRDKVHSYAKGGLIQDYEVAEECADVLITLYRVAELCGCKLQTEVDKKMVINRGRQWVKDGTGNGQHK